MPNGSMKSIRPRRSAAMSCDASAGRVAARKWPGRAHRLRPFSARGRDEPRIPGVAPRCEYGIEILVVLAFLVYTNFMCRNRSRRRSGSIG